MAQDSIALTILIQPKSVAYIVFYVANALFVNICLFYKQMHMHFCYFC